MNKRVVIYMCVLVLLVSITSAFIIIDNSNSDFSKGTYYQTFYNYSGFIQLNSTYNNGSFISRIFDAEINSSWNNILWWREYGFELPNYGTEEYYVTNPANMTGNQLLMHLNEYSGLIIDNSKNGNNAINNGATYAADGKFNTALFFGGDGDVVESNSYTYTFEQELTFAAWFKYSGAGTGSPRILEISKNGDANSHALVPDADGSLRAWVECNTGSRLATVDDPNNYNDGEWHFMVYTYSNPSGILYVDGIQTATAFGACSNLDDGSYLVIGAISDGSGAYTHAQHEFDGYIDEISVWNRSLNSNEVLDFYKRGILRLNLSVRSCNYSNCSGENWINLDDTSSQNLSSNGVSDNQYFQYKFIFETDNVSYSPKLFNVTLDYTTLDFELPVVNSVNITTPIVKRSSTIISVNATDNIGIRQVVAEINNPNGTTINLSLSQTSQDIYEVTFSNTENIGMYNITIYVTDVGDNTDTKNNNFTVKESNWFSPLFRYRLPVLIEEKNNIDRVNSPTQILLSFSYHDAKNNSIRVVNDDNEELPYQIENAVFSGEKYQNITLIFPVNISANSSRIFYIYYSDTNITPASFSSFFSHSEAGNEHTFETDKLKVKLNNKYDSIYAGITEWYSPKISNDLLSTDDSGIFNTGLITWGDARDTLGLAPELIVNGSIYKKYKWIKNDGSINITFYRGTNYIKSEFDANSFTNYFASGDENTIFYSASTLNFPDTTYYDSSSQNFSYSNGWHKSFNVSNFTKPWYYISNNTNGFVFTFNHLSDLKELFGAAYSNTIEAPSLEFNTLHNDFTFYISYISGNNSDAKNKYIEMTQSLNYTSYAEEIPEDNEAPIIVNVNILPNNIELGSQVTISSEITDNFEVTFANATIEYPNGSISFLNLTNQGNNTFSNSLILPLIGTYNVYISAIDGKGNINNTSINPSSLTIVTQHKITSNWFNNSWHYRIPLFVKSENYTKINDLAKVQINLTQILINNNINGTLDLSSLRIIEHKGAWCDENNNCRNNLNDWINYSYDSVDYASLTNGASISENNNNPIDDVDNNTGNYGTCNWPCNMTITLNQTIYSGQFYTHLWDGNNRWYNYSLWISNGGNTWTKVVNNKRAQGIQYDSFTPQNISHVRIEGIYNTANNGFHIMETEVNRLYPYYTNTTPLLYDAKHPYYMALDYNLDATKLTWLMNGTISSNQNNTYYLYFDIQENGNKSTHSQLDWLKDEYVVTAGNSGLIHYIHSLGNGSFETQQFIEDVGNNVWGLGVGDFDNDGDFDVVSGNSAGETKLLRHLTSNGSFDNSLDIGTFTSNNYAMDIATDDFNNDGNLDFVISGNNDDYTLFLGQGNGSFQKTVLSTSGFGIGRGKDSGDIDNDGNIDFISATSGSQIYLWKGQGNGSFETSLLFTAPDTNSYGLAVADFDGDNNLDIYLGTKDTGEWFFYRGNGNGTFNSGILMMNLEHHYNGGDAFDYNKDGFVDLVRTDYTDRDVYFYEGFENHSVGNELLIGSVVGGARMGISAPTIERLPNITTQNLEILPELNLSYSYSPQSPTTTNTITFIINVTSPNTIAKCEISIDTSSYGLMTATDGNYDETEESAKYLTSLTSGEHHISEKCTDDTGISGSVNFNLNATSTITSVCGNNIKESAEECDGNDGVSSGYSCNSQCELVDDNNEGNSVVSGGGSGGGGKSNTNKIITPKEVKEQEIKTPEIAENFTIKRVNKMLPNKITKVLFDGKINPINSIEISTNTKANNVSMKIRELDTIPKLIPELNNTYKYLKIIIKNLDNNMIQKAVINFNVNKSWIKMHQFDSVSLYRYHNNSWIKLKTEKFNEDNQSIYYKAQTPGFSYFAIVAQKTLEIQEDITLESPVPIEKQEKNYMKWVILIAILILVIIFISKNHYVKKYFKTIKKDVFKNKVQSNNNNSIQELIGKNVFTDEGLYIGIINKILLDLKKSRIGSLLIEIKEDSYLYHPNKQKKGINLSYTEVKNVGDVMIINHLNKQKIHKQIIRKR